MRWYHFQISKCGHHGHDKRHAGPAPVNSPKKKKKKKRIRKSNEKKKKKKKGIRKSNEKKKKQGSQSPGFKHRGYASPSVMKKAENRQETHT